MNTLTPVLDAGPADPIRRGYLAETWLPSYRAELATTDRLCQLASKRKAGPDRDALFAGYCAVHRDMEKTIQAAARVGGLPLMWEGSKALKECAR